LEPRVQTVRKPLIVRVQKCYPFTATSLNSRIACSLSSLAFVMYDQPDTWVLSSIFLHNLNRVVVRPVVHDNGLKIRMGLIQHALNRTLDLSATVKGRKDH